MVKLKKLAGVEYLPITSIVVGERLRKDSTAVREKVEEIAKSIKTMGPLQPILLDDKDNLIDGGCRYEAYTLLGAEEVPVVRRSRIKASTKFMLEVEANLRRSDLTWQEKVEAIGKVHDMKEEEAEKASEEWGQRATGSLLKMSVASINNALTVWKALKKGDEEVKGCENLSEALMLLVERKKKAAVNLRLATHGEAPVEKSSAKPIVFELGKAGSKTPTFQPPVYLPEKDVNTMRKQTIPLDQYLHNADCVAWMLRAPKDSVDIIVTDIPYGIDVDNMEDIKNIDMMRDTHEVDNNVDMMPEFLKAAYHILRPNSYLFFFYALQHHEKLRNWGIEAGFNPVEWPLIWTKPHSCKNNAPQCNPTKSFEPCYVMKKGSPILTTPMTKCHLEVDGMPDKKQQSNPFAKPLDWLTKMIFQPVGLPHNAICLDPYAGEGSILSAAILNGLTPIGIEIDKERFPSLVSRVMRLYKNVLNNAVDFTLPKNTDVKSL